MPQIAHTQARPFLPRVLARPAAISLVLGLLSPLASPARAQQLPFSMAEFAMQGGKAAKQVRDGIWLAVGFSNSFLVQTSAGGIVIDTSSPLAAAKLAGQLKDVCQGPVKYVVLTHAHNDHTGGANLWRAEGAEIIAQQNFPAFRDYQIRIGGYLARSSAQQFGLKQENLNAFTERRENLVEPQHLVADRQTFTLGDVEFEVLAAPGETPDHCLVWLPKHKALFAGDNIYDSFPNMYTLRGTTPRWPLDYIAALDKMLALEPELLLPSHGQPTVGADKVRARLEKYRRAIAHVHDATVAGMNAGKDPFTLMREVRLPPELEVGEGYGKVAWSVRGIYEGYVGWFDGNPATMYDQPATAADRDLVELAGGAAKVVERAREAVAAGDEVRAVRLVDAALRVDPRHAEALQTRVAALKKLQKKSRNMIESAWLASGIRDSEERLKGSP